LDESAAIMRGGQGRCKQFRSRVSYLFRKDVAVNRLPRRGQSPFVPRTPQKGTVPDGIRRQARKPDGPQTAIVFGPAHVGKFERLRAAAPWPS